MKSLFRGGGVRISAVVPVLDEAATIRELHERLAAVLSGLADEHEIVFVNDGSTDGSLAELRAAAARDPKVAVVDLRRNFGKAAALAAGFAEARGDVLVTIDADLQDIPEEIPRLIARIREGAEVVTGRKVGRRDPWTRRAASWVFNRAVSRLTGTRVHDVNSGLKALTREAVRELPLYGELHRFVPVLASARGFAVAEVDVTHAPRRSGRSRYGASRYAAGLLDPLTVLLLTRYGKRPLHFFGLVGGALALAGGAILAYLVAGWFFGHWIGSRPALPLAVLLILIGIQSAFFGLLAELIITARSDGDRGDRGYSVRSVIRGAREGAASPAATQGETRR
jgi:glycosyltransferase involved in cell wall biosynthesis